MQVVETHDLLNSHLFSHSQALHQANLQILDAIKYTDWPHGSGSFSIYPESGKKKGEGNGVVPIKIPCVNYLRQNGWITECVPDLGSTVLAAGDLDALKATDEGYIAFEWETGNISSSHRALNKLFLTMQQTNTIGSFLIVPSNKFKVYLTDRVGNIGELLPYFPLWRSFTGISGALRIIVVEHDNTSFDVPKIPKGTDGRALG